MTPAEVDQLLESAAVGILSTLRRDGSPIALPMWFVVVDGRICFRSRETGRKVARLAHDDRVCFVVEHGAAWSELAAVVVSGRAERVAGELAERVEAALNRKYDGRGVPEAVPQRTRQHYAVPTVHYQIVAERPTLTWNNAKLL